MRWFLFLFCVLPSGVFADDWDALRVPGAHAIMRHALAPGGGDPAGFDVTQCATQRNLNDQGRRQAQSIGQSLRDRGISFDVVLTSQWCRCRETASLMDVGPVQDATALNSFFQNRSTADTQTRAATELIRTAQTRTLMVTHQVNITALTGVFPASGEIIVIRHIPDGIEVLGRIEIAP